MTRVLVVDDSALMRRLVRQVLDDAGGFETAFAADGEEALAQMRVFAPDVVTLDVNMPRMDGLACLDRIMLERPTPVIMLSAMTAEGAEQSVEALSLGAVDVLQKPSGPQSLGIDALGPVLVKKIRAAKGARLRHAHRLTERVRILTRGVQAEPRGSRSAGRSGARSATLSPAARWRRESSPPRRLRRVWCWSAAPPAGPRPSTTC